MTQPVIAKQGDQHDTDGKMWAQALVDSRGRILAGRDAQLNFHLFVSPEELFDQAMASLYKAMGVKLEDIVSNPADGTTTENGAPS